MEHKCEQIQNILEVTKEISCMKERLAILETNNMHVMTCLVEIKASLATLVTQSSSNSLTISNSKGFVAGVIATVSISISLVIWLLNSFVFGKK